MAVTQFSSADLIPALEVLQPPESFLNATFFPQTSYFIGRFCQVDTRKARRWIAPVVKRGQIARETTVSDLDDRLMGESAYSRRTPTERLAEVVAQDLIELVGAVKRRIENMNSHLLIT
jgi:hypothetical protein